ncbi:Rhs element Vgr protein, partial [Pseudomonas syringae pv. actinidiae ICMP 19101]
SVRYLGNDGGLHDWQLVFAPWFSLLEYRLDCRIWQDKNLPAILEAVFSLYEQAKGNYRLDLRREYAPLSYVTQFNESDANFVQRWCEQEGLFWYVEHTADKHCIVFTDTVDTLPALAPQSIRFHTQNVTEKQDGITQWSSGSQLLSGKLHWRSVDYLAHG